MLSKVPYTSVAGKHRPYLEVFFTDILVKKLSTKTFAMVDSGADHTVLSFSLGQQIGLEPPSDQEILANMAGVGGSLSYIERKCRIYIADKHNNLYYGFDETVWWIYPDKAMIEETTRLLNSKLEFENLQKQCIPDTPLYKHFQNQIDITNASYATISAKLEGMLLLGRNFFNNFDFIQFLQKDKMNEEKCSFNYKVAKGKIVDSFPIIAPSQEKGQVAVLQTRKDGIKQKPAIKMQAKICD